MWGRLRGGFSLPGPRAVLPKGCSCELSAADPHGGCRRGRPHPGRGLGEARAWLSKGPQSGQSSRGMASTSACLLHIPAVPWGRPLPLEGAWGAGGKLPSCAEGDEKTCPDQLTPALEGKPNREALRPMRSLRWLADTMFRSVLTTVEMVPPGPGGRGVGHCSKDPTSQEPARKPLEPSHSVWGARGRTPEVRRRPSPAWVVSGATGGAGESRSAMTSDSSRSQSSVPE